MSAATSEHATNISENLRRAANEANQMIAMLSSASTPISQQIEAYKFIADTIRVIQPRLLPFTRGLRQPTDAEAIQLKEEIRDLISKVPSPNSPCHPGLSNALDAAEQLTVIATRRVS